MRSFTVGMAGRLHEVKEAEQPDCMTYDDKAKTLVLEFPSRILCFAFQSMIVVRKDKDGS